MKRTFWLHTICSVVIVLLVGLIVASPAVSADPVEVSADQVKAMLDGDKATVIFPLSLIEFNNLHIKGSVNVPIAEIPADLPADKTRALVFYCLGFTWTASLDAARLAVSSGYQDVSVFRGGLPEWIKAGYPTVTVEKLPKVNAPVVTPQQLKAMLDSNEDFVLLDIRLAVDEARYWIEDPRRLSISLNKLPADYGQIPKGKKMVLIDKIGKRAGVAARFLSAKGFDNITVTSGGMNDWIKSGLPTKINK